MKRRNSDFLVGVFWFFAIIILAGALFFAVSSNKTRRTAAKHVQDFLVDDENYTKEIRTIAGKYGLPPELVTALIRKESRFNPKTRGKAGEIGLMQILPEGAVADWARINKVQAPTEAQLFRVENNLEIGCWYLARAMKRWEKYRCGMEMALAEYNAGAKNVTRWKPDDYNGEFVSRIDFPITRKYVTEIMENYRKYISKKKQ